MRKIRIFFYTIAQGFTGFRKNILMILASIYVIFVALLLIGALNLVSVSMQNELNGYVDKPEIRIDCATEITDEDRRRIEAHPAVYEITYISKEENLNKFLALLGDDSDVFEGYSEGADAFYISFDVKLKNPDSAEQFVADMYKVSGVEYVKDNISVVKTFKNVTAAINAGTVVSIIIMGALSVFLASNTIRLTVLTRKKAIEIMKYVGASHFYITGPYLMEGLVIGSVGAVLAYFVLQLLYEIIKNNFSGGLIFTMLPFSQAGGGLLATFIIFGMIVGVLASIIAIRRYEKV